MHKEASNATSSTRKIIAQLTPQANEDLNDVARMALCCLYQREASMFVVSTFIK